MRSMNFELVLNGKTVVVIVEPYPSVTMEGQPYYKVLLQGKPVGMLWRTKRASYRCKHNESNQVFAGRTRENAAKSMIFSCCKER